MKQKVLVSAQQDALYLFLRVFLQYTTCSRFQPIPKISANRNHPHHHQHHQHDNQHLTLLLPPQRLGSTVLGFRSLHHLHWSLHPRRSTSSTCETTVRAWPNGKAQGSMVHWSGLIWKMWENIAFNMGCSIEICWRGPWFNGKSMVSCRLFSCRTNAG